MYKVIVADDEYMVKVGLRTLIEDEAEGFSVVGEAEDGGEALELVARLEPDLLITDIRMPVMDGLELIREMKRKGLRTDAVIVSGYGEFSYAQEAIRNGAADYLLKPIETDMLLTALNRLREKWSGGEDERVERSPDEAACGETAAEGDPSGSKSLVAEAIAYMETRFADPHFSLKDAAHHFHVSPAYFSFMFKKAAGIPFIQYVTRLRMERAKRMLADGENKIYVVGHAVGYPEYTHFAKAFKKYCGFTPTEYRIHLGMGARTVD